MLQSPCDPHLSINYTTSACAGLVRTDLRDRKKSAAMMMKLCAANGGAKSRNNKMERKTVEKYRRLQMKNLCFKLSSLIPKQHRTLHKDVTTQQDKLEQATSYIKILEERIEKLKQTRMMHSSSRSGGGARKSQLPIVEVRHQGVSCLEVLIISGTWKRFMFHEVISLLEEEGAGVVNASFSVVGDRIIHTIHSQAVSSRIGLEASRVAERLKELVI